MEQYDPPFPLDIGTSWHTDENSGRVEHNIMGYETIVLRGHQYENCLKISISDKEGTVSGYSYFAPDIGPIRHYVKVNGITLEYVLHPDNTAMLSRVLSSIKMLPIPAGTFLMGADSGATMVGTTNRNGDTVHSVILSAFTMSETDITQEQYQTIMDTNPSHFKTGADAPRRPVEQVCWYDAVRFCNKLSQNAGKTNCYDISNPDSTQWTCDMNANGYRLPTEAEWEYACKGGTATTYCSGADTNGMGAHAWSTYDSGITTHPVATKIATAYGLYDMAGNVWQWCNDWYGTYAAGAVTNPQGASGGLYRVLRGGGWGDDETYLRSTYRYDLNPDYRNVQIGFRVVLPVR